MKKDEKETKSMVKEKAGEGKPFTEKAKAKIDEEAGEDGVFTEKPKKVVISQLSSRRGCYYTRYKEIR
jgi:hypothetical protein